MRPMKHILFSRREALQLSGLAMSSVSFSELFTQAIQGAIGLVRVSVKEMRIFKEPDYESTVTATRKRDELIPIYENLISPYGPAFNPRWYRVEEGYAHTAYLQPVKSLPQTPAPGIPDTGQLGEISVPITQSMRHTKAYGWQPLYRLYYKSVHWVTDINYGPDMTPWYELKDDLLKITYWIPAKHVRLVQPEELTPLSPDIPPHEKHIEVSIKRQSLTAFEGKDVVMHTEVSTGIPNVVPTSNGVSTATPYGDFNIELKLPVRHMGNGKLTSNIHAYELPGIPWVSFFHKTGVAFHGTYFHDNYGNEMSHGCVNMRPEEAKWLWRWTTPVARHDEWLRKGKGTSVTVI